ncbi:hypothetical protein [Pontibacter indicus]|uniref:hypothetical protein n=1 Tax=Pontibacter indicus TaxID=1317125 RepID=UPI00147BA75A|nr:hypothetical protein [Pontibacter indicus]
MTNKLTWSFTSTTKAHDQFALNGVFADLVIGPGYKEMSLVVSGNSTACIGIVKIKLFE